MGLVLVDLGVGNILSVSRALEAVGTAFTRSADPRVVAAAERVVLPGVGAFAACRARVDALGLAEPLRQVSLSGRPLLGICVGMQLLLTRSEEFGGAAGLDLVPGVVRRLPDRTPEGARSKVPHIGWSGIEPAPGGAAWTGGPLAGTPPGAAFYFLHSFAAETERPEQRLALATYGGRPVTAALHAGNTFGLQFHPEKSGPAGLEVLRRFVSL